MGSCDGRSYLRDCCGLSSNIRDDLRGDLLDHVTSLRRDMEQGQLSDGKDLIHEGIPFTPILAPVTAVVQFDANQWLHRRRVAEQKIDVLAVDLVPVGAELAFVFQLDPEHIA